MKKIFKVSLIGIALLSFSNAKSIMASGANVIKPFNVLHVRNTTVNQGQTIRIIWDATKEGTILGCSLGVVNIARNGTRATVFTTHSPSGAKNILNAQPKRYNISISCRYKFKGDRSETKVVNVRFKPRVVPATASQKLDFK